VSGKPVPDDDEESASRGEEVSADRDASATATATAREGREEDRKEDRKEDGEEGGKKEDSQAEDSNETEASSGRRRRRLSLPNFEWAGLVAWVVLPAVALVLAIAAGFLRWQYGSLTEPETAEVQVLQAAREGTTAMLSYKPETVDKDLTAARDYLTGNLLESYTKLTTDVVIPGSRQRQVSAVAYVPAAAQVSASWNHAVVLVFVNQTTTIGGGAPTDMASTVRVKLDKIGDRWLISEFEPI
jgi:Mce-associated membrane protein